MSKKIKYLSILLIASLFFVGTKSVNAKISCYYKNSDITMAFSINDDGSASRVSISGFLESSDETDINDETEPISNWNDKKFTSFVGKDYYMKNKKCPPYLSFYDRRGSFKVYVGKTKDEMKKIKNELKSCNWWTLCINGGVQGWTGAVALSEQNGSINNNKTKGNSKFTPTAASCPSFTNKKNCEQSTNPRCVWNSQYKLCSVNGNAYLSCGDAKDIPPIVPELISYAVNLLKIGTPIILIIVGLFELVKAVAASSEDAIKKAQSKLIKKVVAAVMVFFVIAIVQFVILKVADSSEVGGIQSCLKCFLNGTGDCDSIYVKDGYGQCYFKNGSSKACGEIAQSKK